MGEPERGAITWTLTFRDTAQYEGRYANMPISRERFIEDLCKLPSRVKYLFTVERPGRGPTFTLVIVGPEQARADDDVPAAVLTLLAEAYRDLCLPDTLREWGIS